MTRADEGKEPWIEGNCAETAVNHSYFPYKMPAKTKNSETHAAIIPA